MNSLQAEQLCAACGLGALHAGPLAIGGGRLHLIWRLTTERGIFAVKGLNPALIRKPGMRDAYRLSERIAAAMISQGVPAVAALACAGDPLQEVDDAVFMLYPWVDGEVLSSAPVEPARTGRIGTILAHMHALLLHFPELYSSEHHSFLDDDWDMLTFHAAAQDIPWAYQVRAALPRLIEWSRWDAEAETKLASRLVVSHRELDQTNVIWRDAQTPVIIDWEAAGLINPTVELAGSALSWSGLRAGEVREDIFTALVEAYMEAGGTISNESSDVIGGVIGAWLGWLRFTMRRSFGESTTSEEERLLNVQETLNTLAILRLLGQHWETWAAWVEKWRS